MITKEHLKYLLCTLIGVLVTYLVMNHYNPVKRVVDTSVHSTQTTSKTPITTATDVTLVQKDNPSSPDLVVRNVYVADIDGKQIEAPVVTKKDDQQAIVKSVIDVTPLVKQMTPKWEAGVGVDVDNNYKVSPCVSLQRNYKQDKAVEMVITINKENGKVERGMLLHKWMF